MKKIFLILSTILFLNINNARALNGSDFLNIFTDEEIGNYLTNAGGLEQSVFIKITGNAYGTITQSIFDSVITNMIMVSAIPDSGSRYDQIIEFRPSASPTDNNYIRENDLNSALEAKQDVINPAAHIDNGATNAATNAPTDLNLLLLLTASTELNASNARYNDLAAKYNDLAAKFNTLMAHIETQGLQLTE